MTDEPRDTDLVEQFKSYTDIDPSDIPSAIYDVMEYISRNTGLLGDYHDGIMSLAEGGSIIQWYARGNFFSAHDDLLHWVQMEADGVMLAQVGVRPHPLTGESTPYAEIQTPDRWGYEVPTGKTVTMRYGAALLASGLLEVEVAKQADPDYDPQADREQYRMAQDDFNAALSAADEERDDR